MVYAMVMGMGETKRQEKVGVVKANMWKKAVLNEIMFTDTKKCCFERKQKQRC